MLKFITGNKNKFEEVKELLKPIKVSQINIDLDEIQDIDPYKIIKYKLKQAFKRHKGPFIIEDSSLEIAAFGKNLPGPFIKYFNYYLGPKNIANLAIKMKKQQSRSTVLIAYAQSSKKVTFFKGEIFGIIVMPKGKYGFGYDPIFKPRGSKLTLGEMKLNNNFSFSARGKAVKQLKNYILGHGV